MIPTITYGDRVRRTRLSQGLTQAEFADAIHADRAVVARHELMDVPPGRNRRGLVSLIELRFGVPSDWLLTGSVPAPRARVTEEYREPSAAVVVDLDAYRAERFHHLPQVVGM